MTKFDVQVITVAPGNFGGGTALGSNKVVSTQYIWVDATWE